MINFSPLFWYKLVFMAELIIAEMLFTFRLKKKNNFVLRFSLGVIVCFGVAFAFPIFFYNAAYSSFMFLTLFATSILLLKFCYLEPWTNIIFCAIAAYTIQHIAYEVFDLSLMFSRANSGYTFGLYGSDLALFQPSFITYFVYFDCYLLIYWLAYFIFGTRMKKEKELKIKSVFMLVIAGGIVLFDIVFSAVITYLSYSVFNSTYLLICYLYNISCCVLALCIQFGLLSHRNLKAEFDTVNHLWKKDQEHYSIFKENVDLINIKCHDLKHQIRRIGESGSLKEEIISEMESMISIYDAQVKTGNETLDIILTEKSLLCSKNKTVLTCMVDGEGLSFLSEADIYSLFGNAIDNAIEAVSKLENGDKRNIGLVIKKVNSFLSINLHNYYDSELEFIGGLPITTKLDKSYHGYGMKSIKMIVDKYNGDVTVAVKNGLFNLNIFFPLI